MPSKLAAVIFDLDDTLIVEARTAEASMHGAVRLVPGVDPAEGGRLALSCVRDVWHAGPYYERCRALGIASWEGLWADFTGCHPSLAGLAAWAEEYRTEAWLQVTEALGHGRDPALAAALADRFVALQRRGHPMVEGAAATVRSLAMEVPLGLLTNGPPDIQLLKLDRTGLGDCFRSVVISGSLGIGKPDREAFRAAVRNLGLACDESVVMVGDSWERDVEGARSAGMRPVWVHQGRAVPADLDVAVVHTVAQLPSVLG